MEAMWLTAIEGNYEKDSAMKALSKPRISAATSQMRSRSTDHLTVVLDWVLYTGGHRVKLPSHLHLIMELRIRGDLLRPCLLRVSAG
jgi:hypothetical protein